MTENNRMQASYRTYCPSNYVDTELNNGNIIPGEWRKENTAVIQNLRPSSAHGARTEAYSQRDMLKNYFLTSEGEVTWRYAYVRRGFNGINLPEN